MDQQPYIRELRQHLRGHPCWRLLQTAIEATYDYEEAARTTYQAICEGLRARLPDVPQPDIEALALSLLKHGFYRAIGYAGAHFNFMTEKLDDGQGSTRYRLILDGRFTSSRDTEEALRPMSDAYQALAKQIEKWEQVRTLGRSDCTAENARSEFQECLEPDALPRKLLLNSRCELCP